MVAAQVNSQLLVFTTDSSVQVIEAKVRTVSDQLIVTVNSTLDINCDYIECVIEIIYGYIML